MKQQNVLIALVLSFAAVGCTAQKNSKQTNKKAYSSFSFPQDSTQLWVGQGNVEKDTVAIFCQGGPSNSLSFLKAQKTSWRYLPQYKNYYKVHLHQSNTYYPEMFSSGTEFTLESARKEVDNSSEILFRAIHYFKSRGKTVYVFGHSYGAFVIPHYLATRASLADKYIMVAGRIEDPQAVVQYHKEGRNGYYAEGTQFIPDTQKEIKQYKEDRYSAYRVKQLLKAAIGEVSYAKALENVDLKNSIYIHAMKDERVGNLSNEEIRYLKEKGLQVHATKYPHGDAIYGLVDLLAAGEIQL